MNNVHNIEKKKKAFFIAVTDSDRTENRAYSNFVYSLCLNAFNNAHNLKEKYDIESFKRHDLLEHGSNLKDSIYNCINEYDTFIILLDDYNANHNANVWFELGMVSTQRNKTIVLIAREKQINEDKVKFELPFHVANARVVQINIALFIWFENNIGLFKETDGIKERLCTFPPDMEQLTRGFSWQLISRINDGENPFKHEMDLNDLKSIGYNSLYSLFEKSNIIKYIQSGGVFAEFIDNEKDAFLKLSEAIKEATDSLRTSRSANQSIVASGNGANQDVHAIFMSSLKEKSKHIERFDRIICNNHWKKWYDIREILLYGGPNTRVFVRKKAYALGFELVVVDEKVSFIHFYQDNKNRNSEYAEHDSNESDKSKNQVINSTLKITGRDVGKHLADVFDRFHHRDFQNENKSPSRTLLGIPDDMVDKAVLPEKYLDCGCLKLSENTIQSTNDALIIDKRKNQVNRYLLDKFFEWCSGMNLADRMCMAEGVAALDVYSATKILERFEKIFNDFTTESEKEDFKEIIKSWGNK